MPTSHNQKQLGYLSAAPRVSTHLDTEMSGPRAHVLGVISGFKSLGWDVYPYIVGDLLPGSLVKDGAQKMERNLVARLGADLLRLLLGMWHSFRSWHKLRGNVDWVYERFAVLQCLGWIFQRQGIPWILETNGLLFHEATIERKSIYLTGLAQMMEIWAYKHCDVLICVANGLKELLVDVAKISPDKVLVVPNGVDIGRCDPEQHSPKRMFDGPTLGFIGGLYNWRRLDLPLQALAELKREDIVYNFTIVGDGPMRDAWESWANNLGLGECVRFVGRVPWNDAPGFIAGFDLGYIGFTPVDGKKMFGSPLKLFEYMAMAVPVVASEFSDSIELISPGHNGYIFCENDVESIKQVLRLAFKDRNRWRQMGDNARERVLNIASWTARVKNMVIGIESVLESNLEN